MVFPSILSRMMFAASGLMLCACTTHESYRPLEKQVQGTTYSKREDRPYAYLEPAFGKAALTFSFAPEEKNPAIEKPSLVQNLLLPAPQPTLTRKDFSTLPRNVLWNAALHVLSSFAEITLYSFQEGVIKTHWFTEDNALDKKFSILFLINGEDCCDEDIQLIVSKQSFVRGRWQNDVVPDSFCINLKDRIVNKAKQAYSQK